MKAFLDTHAAVALAEGRREVFGHAATDLLERSALFISPAVRLELAFLKELQKIRVGADEILAALKTDVGLALAPDPIDQIVDHAIGLDWTRDPFDRLLVATALLHRSPLITRDRNIHDHFSEAVW